MRLRRVRFGWGAAAVVAVACGTEPDPADLLIEVQETPFYFHRDERVDLRVHPTQLIIQATVGLRTALPSILINSGVLVDSVRPMADDLGYDVVWLHEGTSAGQAAIAADDLRPHLGVSFVSNVYLYSSGETVCPLRLRNAVNVKPRSSTTPEQMRALLRRAGLAVESEQTYNGTWRARYPIGSPHTPLEIVAALARHAFVDWATPDMLGCAGPT